MFREIPCFLAKLLIFSNVSNIDTSTFLKHYKKIFYFFV
nr:MAG TPA: hypothetical protein [Caudoviricetes sp.]